MYEIERAKIGISLYEKASNVDIFICESVAIKWYFSIRKSENWHFAKEVEKLVNLSKIFKTKATDQSTLCPKIETELCRERVVLNLTEWLPFLAKMQKVQGKIRCNNPFSPPPPPPPSRQRWSHSKILSQPQPIYAWNEVGRAPFCRSPWAFPRADTK